MNADSLLEGEYIKAVEFGTKLPANPTYIIVGVEIERLPNLKKPGKEINKGVVMFREIERGWVMNRTNVECLKAMFGPDTEGWVGKRVTLGTEPTKTGPGIRAVGSPDIDREVIAEWTPPRQRKVTKRLVPTGERPRQNQPPTDPLLAAITDAMRKRGWTKDEVGSILGVEKAADVPADQRDAIIERLRGDRPTLPPEGDEGDGEEVRDGS